MKYCRLCKLLSDQGFLVIIATISMFKEVYAWNRENLPDYFEVYMKASLDELRRRDPKGIYKGHLAGEIHNVAGMDLEIDVPENPHILLQWSNGRTEESMFNELLKKIQVIIIQQLHLLM